MEFSGNVIASWIVYETGYIKTGLLEKIIHICDTKFKRIHDFILISPSELWGILLHYNDIIMNAMASQITGVSIVYSTVCSGADQRKHQNSTLVALLRGIHRWPVNCPHKGPLTRKIFPFDDVIMILSFASHCVCCGIAQTASQRRNGQDCMTFQTKLPLKSGWYNRRVHSRFAPSQWEMSLQSNTVCHWLGANLESAL